MRAAVFHGVGKPLVIEEVSDPDVLPGDLLIKVDYCGICGSDLHCTQPGDLVVPEGQILGHEFTGNVVEVGSAAGGDWKVGDRVTAVPVNACDECDRQCKLGMGIHCPNNIITGFGIPGAYAEYIRVDATNVLRLPDGVGFREGATAEPFAVGHHVIDKARMRPGSNVLVIGAGPIGLSCATFAILAGARNVVVSEYAEPRRERALRMGATAVIDPAKRDVAEAFADLAGGLPDLVIECVGVPGMIGLCIDLVKPQGKVMVCGVCTQPETFVPLAALATKVGLGDPRLEAETAHGRLGQAPLDRIVIHDEHGGGHSGSLNGARRPDTRRGFDPLAASDSATVSFRAAG